MDEQVTVIIKNMAMGMLAEDDCGFTCLHCNASATTTRDDIETEEIDHKPDCPVILARKWLQEHGTPMNIYKMSCESRHLHAHHGEYWTHASGYTLALSEEEAMQQLQSDRTRNIQAVFHRVLPIGGKASE